MSTENIFLNLHVHSHYSARDSLIGIDDLVDLAKKNNEAVAICDHGSLHSWFEIDQKFSKAGLKPVYGVEAYVNRHRDRLFEIKQELKGLKDKERRANLNAEKKKIESYEHVVLIAKNQWGFHNIIRLMNNAYRNSFHKKPIITFDDLRDLPADNLGSRGIIITTACIGGTFGKLILNNEYQAAYNFAATMKKEWGNDFYLELQFNDMDEQRMVNKAALEIGHALGIRTCIGSDAHFIHADMADDHQDLLLIQNKRRRADMGKKDWKITYQSKTGSIRTARIEEENGTWNGVEIRSLNKGDRVGNDRVIKIELVDRVWLSKSMPYRSEAELREFGRQHHPEVQEDKHDEIFGGNRDIYNKIEPAGFDKSVKLPTIPNADKILTDMVYSELQKRFPDKAEDPEYLARIKHELATIQGNGFSEYFLIIQDFMKFAREQNIPLGAGRGSGVSSLVGYILGIHNVNPLHGWGTTGLPFRRFLSDERGKKKIIIRDATGQKKEYLESDVIRVKRNDHIIEVPAIELQEGDMPPQ